MTSVDPINLIALLARQGFTVKVDGIYNVSIGTSNDDLWFYASSDTLEFALMRAIDQLYQHVAGIAEAWAPYCKPVSASNE